MDSSRIIEFVKCRTEFYKNIFNKKLMMNLNDSNILDIGCGTGIVSFSFSPLVKSVMGIDPSQAMIDVANRSKTLYKSTNVTFIKGIFSDLCSDVNFNVIIMSNLLHIVNNFNYIMEKALSLLKQNGILYIKHPTEKSIFGSTDLKPNHEEFNKIKYDKWILNIKKTKRRIYKYIKSNNLLLVYKYTDNNLHLFISK